MVGGWRPRHVAVAVLLAYVALCVVADAELDMDGAMAEVMSEARGGSGALPPSDGKCQPKIL